MKHKYNISGMTCGGCKASVEEQLNTLAEVTEVEIDLASGNTSIAISKHIELSVLQDALSDKYQISELHEAKTIVMDEPEVSELKQLQPLFLIFAYIIATALLINRANWDVSSIMFDFMGLFYIVFSFFKFLDLKGFPDSFKMYDPIAKKIGFYAIIYPFIEFALGLSLLFRFQTDISLWVTIVILGATTIGVTKSLLDKKAIKCACLGTALKLPMTKATFIENSIMLVMAFYMIAKSI